MTKLQITITARYVGRGFWRRIFGSGPIRITPIDVAVSDKDRQEVEAATTALQGILAAQEPTKHRVGSLANVEDLRVDVQTKSE